MPYRVTPDPYCYPGSTVLKNIPDLREQALLDEYEKRAYRVRAEQPLPHGTLSVRHYCAIHRHLFQDVYRWAGRLRTVRIAKGASMFCYPEHIAAQMADLFSDLKRQRHLRNLDADTFAASLASFLSTLNAIHPFREGNGRTQMAFALLLAERAGHQLELDDLDPAAFLQSMITAFGGNDTPLIRQIRALILDQ